jgi:hypothetical protein
VLEAIRLGHWNYEPEDQDASTFEATRALPGTRQKVQVIAERVRNGQPLWHPSDRCTFDETEEEEVEK